MGCCRGCGPRPPTSTYDAFPLLLILAVVLILLCLPSLFSSVPIAFETPKIQINWALIAAPLVLLAIVHWLSSMTSSSSYVHCTVWPVPCKRCYHHSCKGCLPGGVRCWLLFCCFNLHGTIIMSLAYVFLRAGPAGLLHLISSWQTSSFTFSFFVSFLVSSSGVRVSRKLFVRSRY